LDVHSYSLLDRFLIKSLSKLSLKDISIKPSENETKFILVSSSYLSLASFLSVHKEIAAASN